MFCNIFLAFSLTVLSVLYLLVDLSALQDQAYINLVLGTCAGSGKNVSVSLFSDGSAIRTTVSYSWHSVNNVVSDTYLCTNFSVTLQPVNNFVTKACMILNW